MTVPRKTRKLPPELARHAREFLAGGKTPVPPRLAATVMLLRDTPRGPEVYLLRRTLGMAFAGGMYAYPGGGVDPRDTGQPEQSWAGPDTAWWAARLDCAESAARGLVCAAVRETFEESGVLLAGPTPNTVVPDTTGEDWEADRAALVARELAFRDFLDRRGLVLRTDLLGAWARWITPEFEPRRYDTYFFVAALPEGQRTRHVAGEADAVVWLRPADALARVAAGEMSMLPPTAVTLEELSAYPTVADVLAAAPGRKITPVVPRATVTGDEVWLEILGEAP
ncbi:NUDIX hydrolase [Carbonactinospora thermoautotrophica]|uniref:NUDIX hydrolase n=1 Tax=Carbonactinospora thermoautotrophica TaxID=1469144 RepID=UPI0035571E21|nr:NUDIX hydrolase [Carbonactinospora thermoautotrophica]